MANTHAVIYIAKNAAQAHMLKNALTDQGIFAYVSNEALLIAGGEIPHGHATAPRVVVHERDAERARQLAVEFDEAGQFYERATRGELSEELDELEEAEESEAPEWPACPSCNRKRQTSCPICETAGSDFPPAFLPDEELQGEDPDDADASGQPRRMVVCETCDEPFVPQFLARCEWCGHRFRDGVELAPPPVVTSPFDEVNTRVWIVLAGLAALLAAVLALFAHITPDS